MHTSSHLGPRRLRTTRRCRASWKNQHALAGSLLSKSRTEGYDSWLAPTRPCEARVDRWWTCRGNPRAPGDPHSAWSNPSCGIGAMTHERAASTSVCGVATHPRCVCGAACRRQRSACPRSRRPKRRDLAPFSVGSPQLVLYVTVKLGLVIITGPRRVRAARDTRSAPLKRLRPAL